MICDTRPSRFSACNIEKLGVAWGRGYNSFIMQEKYSYKSKCHVLEGIDMSYTLLGPQVGQESDKKLNTPPSQGMFSQLMLIFQSSFHIYGMPLYVFFIIKTWLFKEQLSMCKSLSNLVQR